MAERKAQMEVWRESAWRARLAMRAAMRRLARARSGMTTSEAAARAMPTQNALIESFNGKFGDECLNQNWFVDLRDAHDRIEAWQVDYNTVRPHSSLGYLTPEEFPVKAAARPASPPTPVASPIPVWAESTFQEAPSATL